MTSRFLDRKNESELPKMTERKAMDTQTEPDGLPFVPAFPFKSKLGKKHPDEEAVNEGTQNESTKCEVEQKQNEAKESNDEKNTSKEEDVHGDASRDVENKNKNFENMLGDAFSTGDKNNFKHEGEQGDGPVEVQNKTDDSKNVYGGESKDSAADEEEVLP